MKKSLLIALLFSSFAAVAAPVSSITIKPKGEEFKYDVTKFTVKAGTEVSITLQNTSKSMPHNLVLLAKDAKFMDVATQGMSAGMDKGFVPASPLVLHHTKLLKPSESETIKFKAPDVAGKYPFVCTFPGHAGTMNGVMEVVK